MLAIEPEKCIDCGLCSLICPANAIKDGRIDDKLCVECHECRVNCPEEAIIVT